MVFNQVRRLYITLDATDKATRKLKQVDKTANRTGRSMDAAATQARTLRRRLVAAGFGAAILTAAMGRMVGQVANVDRTFARVKGTSGAVVEQMARIRNEANKIGAELPVRIKEAAGAFEQLSYAGFSVQEQLESANDVVNLSIAGNLNMADAAKTAASAVRAFGLEAAEVAQVTNSMAAAFTNSAFTIQELNQSLEFVMPVASEANQTISEMTAALGVLADVGLRGSKAGTALERMFRELAAQSSSAQKAMAKLNLTTEEMTGPDGNFKELNEMVQILGHRLEDLQGVERIKVLDQMFGSRGARAASKLIANTDSFLRKIGDNARAQINATFNTLEGRVESINAVMSSALQGTAIEGGFEISADSSTQEIVGQLDEAAQVMSEAELATAINTAFEGIGSRGAEIFASDLKDADASVQEISESIDDMATASKIAEEQMKSLWGQIEFIKGSLDSLMMMLVSGMKPALDVFFGSIKLVLEALTAMPGVVKGVGMGLAVLNAILIALVGNYLWLIATNKLVKSQFMATAGAQALLQTTTALHAAKVQLLARNYQGALVALTSYTTAQRLSYEWTALQMMGTKAYTLALVQGTYAKWSQVVATKASTAAKIVDEAATLALVSAQVLLGRRTAFVAMQQLGYNNMIRLSALLKAKDTAATYALATAQYAYAGAAGVAATAMWGFNAALEWFETMSIVGQILSVLVGLLFLAVGALQMLGEIDIFGWFSGAADGAGNFLSFLDPLIGAINWTIKLGKQLIGLGIGAVFWAIGAAVDWVVGLFADLYEWYKSLGVVGKIFIGVLMPILPLMWAIEGVIWAVGAAADWLGEKWESFTATMANGWKRLGLIIGGGVKDIMGWLGQAEQAFDQFTTGVNDGIGMIADFLEEIFAVVGALFSGNLEQAAKLAGEGLLGAFADGIKAAAMAPYNALKDALGKARKLLPFSDAKEGPLSELTMSGGSFVKTFAGGIDGASSFLFDTVSGVVGGAMEGAAKISRGIGGAVKTAGSVAGNIAGGAAGVAGNVSRSVGVGGSSRQVHQTNNQEVHFHGEVYDVEQVDEKVRDGMERAADEAEERIDDALDMGSDAIGDVASDFADGFGD